MATNLLPIPQEQLLYKFLQVSLDDKGSFKTWSNARERPQNPDEGVTGINLETGLVEQFNSGIWSELTRNEGLKSFDTLAELIAHEGRDVKVVQVLGFYTPQDGGGGTFYASEGSNLKDIPGLIVTGQNGVKWIRLANWNSLNIKWLGAKGDGIQDETQFINLALDIASRVFVPEGTYLLESPVVIRSSHKKLYGSGENSILKSSPKGWYTASFNIFAKVIEDVTVPITGNTQVKVESVYRFLYPPHVNAVTPADGLPTPFKEVLGREGKTNVKITKAGESLSGILTRGLDGVYTFTSTTPLSTTFEINKNDEFEIHGNVDERNVEEPYSIKTFELAKALVVVQRVGVDYNNSREVRDVTISNIKFYGITVEEVVNSIGLTEATKYDHFGWKASNRIPRLIYLSRTRHIKIMDCYFEHLSFEGIWPDGYNKNFDYHISGNHFKNIGYEPLTKSALPALQCNINGGIVTGNFFERVGTGIGGSGRNLIISHNQVKGFESDGIGWGDTNCYNVNINNNIVYADETNIPSGRADYHRRYAYRAFWSGDNNFYRNMSFKNNLAHFNKVCGWGFYCNSPSETTDKNIRTIPIDGNVDWEPPIENSPNVTIIENNKVLFESPPAVGTIGILFEYDPDKNYIAEVRLIGNHVEFRGIPNDNNDFVVGIFANPQNTNILNLFSSNNYVTGLSPTSSNHFAYNFHPYHGRVNVQMNGDIKTGGRVNIGPFKEAFPDNVPIYASGTFPNPELDHMIPPVFFAGGHFNQHRTVKIESGKAAKFFKCTSINSDNTRQSSGIILVTLQYENSRFSKMYFVSSAFWNQDNNKWYKLSPVFSTDDNEDSTLLLAQTNDHGASLDLAVASNPSNPISNDSKLFIMNILPLSGSEILTTLLNSTPIDTPVWTPWNAYDGQIKMKGSPIESSRNTVDFKIPVTIGGKDFYLLATDK